MLTLIIIILLARALLRPRWYRRPWGIPWGWGGWGMWRRPPMGPFMHGPGFGGMGPGPGFGRMGPGGMGRRGW